MPDSDPAFDEVNRLPLKSLGLKPGMALQTRRLVKGASKKEAQYFGAIEGRGIMVGPLGTEGSKTELEEGDVCVVRGFTGQYEFSFFSKVLQTFEKPFVYALLAYPTRVDARMVRQSLRTKVSWPCKVRVLDGQSAGQALPATLIDLSGSGAMIRSATSLAPIGSSLELCMQVQLEQGPAELLLNAKVCHNNRATYEELHFIGMAFTGLREQDRVVLQSLTRAAAAGE